MKSTKIILAMALATAGLTLPGVAQERPNNQRPTERPKVQRPQERPTERPTERVRGGEQGETRKDARGDQERRERAEGEARKRAQGEQGERPQAGGDKDEPSGRERAIDARKKEAEKAGGVNKEQAIRMAQAEEAKHRERMAKLSRLRDLAEAAGDREKVRKIDGLEKTEVSRHERVLAKAKEQLGAEAFEKLRKQIEAGRRPAGERPTERPTERPSGERPTERPAERPTERP